MKKQQSYRSAVTLSKLCAPIFHALYYISIAGLLLSGIVALIIFLVNLPVEEMLLPPLMSREGEFYRVSLGNGILIDAPVDEVTLADLKCVIYAELIMLAAFFCMMAPVSLFLSKLMKSVAAENPHASMNGRYTMYIGLSVMLGYTFVLFARRFYNYLLVKTFVAEPEMIHLSLGLDFGGLLIGLLILFLGGLIGRASELRANETALEAKK